MPPTDHDGPDGSSLKPVSSLLARFENMSKPGDAAASTSLPSPLPISRSISPAPKPDRLREPPTPTSATKPALAPALKPKPRDVSATHHSSPTASLSASAPTDLPSTGNSLAAATTDSASNAALLKPSNRMGPPPPISPRPIPPPSLLVEPPQSPPKIRATPIPIPDQSAYLGPDTGSKQPASPSPSPRYRVASRSRSPQDDLRRSPRLSPSQPPSPPPPRRSAELRRERDQRDQRDQERDKERSREREPQGLPPPIKRPDRARTSATFPANNHVVSGSIPSEAAHSPAPVSAKGVAEKRASFLNMASSTPEKQQTEEQPPSLPARPRPQASQQAQPHSHPHPPSHSKAQQLDRTMSMPPPKIKAITKTSAVKTTAALSSFDPPPLHHSLATRRTERELDAGTPTTPSNGSQRGPLTTHHTEPVGTRPPLPTRPGNATEPTLPSSSKALIPATSRPPPQRVVRSTVGSTNGSATGASGSSASSGLGLMLPPPPQKRVVSSPTTSTQYPPPPTRANHGRSMTIDRTSSRTPAEFRAPPIALSSTTTPAAAAASPAPLGISPPSDLIISRTGSGYGSGGEQHLIPAASVPSSKPADNIVAAFPDPTSTNRRSPYLRGMTEVNTRYDCRIFDVCGQLVATTGHLTRVWNMMDGELFMSLVHGENIKGTAVAFRPGAHVDDEGRKLWIGTNVGDILEADIATQSVVATKTAAHGRYEIIKIHRHYNELWTIDEGGALFVWGPDDEGNVPSLAGNQDQSYRVPRGHTFSMVVGDELWHATGKELRIFMPTLDGKAQFQVLIRALCQDGAGEICAGTIMPSDPTKAYFGHADGKVTVYSTKDYSCLSLITLGSYKINTLACSGPHIWAGYNNGHICVYDLQTTPWSIKKEWAGHDNPVVKLTTDLSSSYRTGQQQVVSLGADNMIRVWDGLLEDDWLENEMQARDSTYCDFDTLRAHVMTWNAGASTPGSMRSTEEDAKFMQNMLESSGSPDILVFGFQELVDLEDKKATAKRLLKTRKNAGTDQERMSHQYRDWRDFLVRSLDDYMSGELYHLLQTAHMVGLFTCIFVKADLRGRIHNLGTTEIKRGMGGLHGNKGAIVVRFQVDDTSLCFVNCHLAAGQSQTAHRHTDIAAILETSNLTPERDSNTRIDNFVCGGDGSTIMDHELCVLNGDLNYRIDTMSRDTVVSAVKAGNLTKLLDRDQLLVARRRNAGFRLRAFEELPITFAPTYKYDVGTANYDSSEKKRSPAWCDRLLFRGGPNNRVKQLDYRRHEVYVSDHRPVTGRFEFTVKRVNAKRRAVTWMECQQHLESHRDQVALQEKMYYLTHVIGYDKATSEGLANNRH